VRVHTGPEAAQLSRILKAKAFTIGEDIAFAPGQYRPGSITGDALLAHELAHVVQQKGAAQAAGPTEDAAYDSLETDADQAAAGVLASLWSGTIAPTARTSLRSGLQVRRCDDDVTPEVAPPAPKPPKPKPAPPPPPPKPLYQQFKTGEEFQKAIDKVVAEMGGRIDPSLMEGGKMFYNGAIPTGAGNTFPPNDDHAKRMLGHRNKKPYVEIYGGAFGDGWPVLNATVWHEYQHVRQMSRSKGVLVPGMGHGHAQEVEAYCQ
ncbi:MAG: DUF4157 domain-containing protein, partial [bacterium]|nr:DUF4157 domain-containing protein [bacterium]